MKELHFTPYAWAKMSYLRDKGPTEVSFMALSHPEKLNVIIDVLMVPQECSAAYTEFKDNGLADFVDRMVDQGYPLENFLRIWCHTHPGNSATPSSTDHETFKRVFGKFHWGIMFILAKDGSTTCKLRYQVKPVSEKFEVEDVIEELKVYVDEFPDTDKAAWDKEYADNWSERQYQSYRSSYGGSSNSTFQSQYAGFDYTDPRNNKLLGPGWRKTKHGKKVWSQKWYQEDSQAGRELSPDNDPEDVKDYWERKNVEKGVGRPSSQDFRDRFISDESETRKSPIRLYQRRLGRPETNNYGDLTKREKKYLRKHGSLEGFVPFPNDKAPQGKQVKIEKLDLRREEEYTLQDDNEFTWLEEPVASRNGSQKPDEEGLILYDVTLEPKYGGAKYTGVPARTGIEAVHKVYRKLNLPIEEVTCDDDTILEGEFTKDLVSDELEIEEMDDRTYGRLLAKECVGTKDDVAMLQEFLDLGEINQDVFDGAMEEMARNKAKSNDGAFGLHAFSQHCSEAEGSKSLTDNGDSWPTAYSLL